MTSEKQPAVKWLLDVASESEVARHHRVFRIENLDLLDTLGLTRRDGFRYSIDDFSDGLPKYFEQLADAEAIARENAENLTFYQKKLLDFKTKLQTYRKLQAAFALPELPPFPTIEQVQADPEQAKADLSRFMLASNTAKEEIMESGVPLLIPLEPKDGEEAGPNGKWLPFSIALLNAYVNSSVQMTFFDEDPRETTIAFNEVLTAYHDGKASQFDDAVAAYTRRVRSEAPAGIDFGKIRFETFFNHFAPFYYSSVLYIVAFVLTVVSWLVWTRGLNWSAFALILLVFGFHTFAIIARIYISGRPPITNLYTTAVFIGWACVLAGLIIEAIFRLGVGNILASVAGFITLGIAHFLAGDGDTFTVLQAVLDTQFWLATHVVTINLGYAATFVAGLLALIYVIRGLATPSLRPEVGTALVRMTYGSLCFALFFSFIGTVLGGLWADDSWGRFWGWDPKENGALMIVLWNALVLHARWDGMVKDRGVAVLAVLGNIVVGWSWFGVNELGVGLHSYGFTEGVLFTLGLFSLSQLLIAGMGCLPKALWWSHQRHAEV
jgi:ABC-type transport system involved in cytochrome c biogenesis permease subunit